MRKKNKLSNGHTKKVASLNNASKPTDLHNFGEEKIIMSPDHAKQLKEIEETILKAKLQLADLHLQSSDLGSRAVETANLIKARSAEMMNLVRQFAITYGIDPDGEKDNRRWNLDTNQMIFYRIQ